MAGGVTEKRWSANGWDYHVRPGAVHEAELTISYRGTVVMHVLGEAEFCRAMIRSANTDPPQPGDYRCRVEQILPNAT